MLTILLGVNIDHVATLREVRGTCYPDPLYAAMIAQEGGADSITLHPREDRRHIQPRDVKLIKEVLQIPMNMELAITEPMLQFAEEIKPEKICFVPEKREELTTEGGLDILAYRHKIASAVKRLQAVGAAVSLFIDPDEEQVEAAVEVGVKVIEIHTGCYANAHNEVEQNAELQRIIEAVQCARSLNLSVNAGHGLHYHNVKPIAAIRQIRELNIGHAIIAQGLFCGLKEAVSQMRKLMQEARHA